MTEQLSILGGASKPLPVKSKKSPVHSATSKDSLQTPAKILHQQITDGLKKYFRGQKHQKAVLGLSGGVDSSLTLKLAVDALGASNVTALIMPELGLTTQENIDHAKTLAAYFGAQIFYQPINNFLLDFRALPWKSDQKAMMNVKARIRMVLLYSYANTENALVLGTSNKSELMLGYMTKFGDSACDIEVIGDLYKTEVIMLAEYLGLPLEITRKTPTAELAEGQTDEQELGAPYRELDKILSKFLLGVNGCIERGMPVNLTHRVFQMVKRNKHKSEKPFIISINR